MWLRALTNPFIVEKIGGEYIYNMVRGDDNGKHGLLILS